MNASPSPRDEARYSPQHPEAAAASSADDERLTFRVLGPVTALRHGTPIDLGRGKLVMMLTAMLVSANQTVPTEVLAASVWGERLPRNPRASVHQTVSRLRHALATSAIETSATGYRLTTDADHLDLLRFDEAINAARESTERGDYQGAVTKLDEALALWREPVLGGADSPVLHQNAHSLTERYLAAREDRAELLLRLGQHAVVAEELPELVHDHPFRERMVAQLMQALSRSHRRAEALAVYEESRRALADELGIDPSAMLQDVYVRILRVDGEREKDEPPTRDAVEWSDEPAELFRSREGKPAPRQLPVGHADLVGRDAELERLDSWIEAWETDRAVSSAAVLVGPAGVGKTALAAYWARRVSERFPDGLIFVDLRGYSPGSELSAATALERLLRDVVADSVRIPQDVDERASLLRSTLSERRMLLILDNARDAGHVRPLLPGSGCPVLVTSRDQLRGLVAREGARRITVEPIGVEVAGRLLGRVTGHQTRGLPTKHLAELVELCAGLPLAIRIVAERIARERVDLGTLVAELRNAGTRLDALNTGDEMADVRGALSWSYRWLDPEPARVFRRLGLHPGEDLGLPAVSALVGQPANLVRRLVDALLAVHLLEQSEPNRYRLHDLLRVHAVECAEAEDDTEDRALAFARLIGHFRAGARAAARLVYSQHVWLPHPDNGDFGFDSPRTAVSWLEKERANLRALVLRASASERPEDAWLITDALRPFYRAHRYIDDWRATAEASLRAAERTGDMRAAGAMHLSLGKLSDALSRFDDALKHYEIAIGLHRQAGWELGEATAMTSIAVAYYNQGRYREGIEMLERSQEIFERHSSLAGSPINLNNLALMYRDTGRHDDAERVLRQAIALNQALGSRDGEAINLNNLGMVLHDRSRFGEAAEVLSRSLALNRELGSRESTVFARMALAEVENYLGHGAAAFAHAEAALRFAEGVDDQRLVSDARNMLGTASRLSGSPRRAAREYQLALRAAERAGVTLGQAVAYAGHAAAMLAVDDTATAVRHARAAVEMARRIEHRVAEAEALVVLAESLRRLGEYAPARTYGEKALAINHQIGRTIGVAQANRVLADVLADCGDVAGAREHRAAADRISDELGTTVMPF